MSDTTGGAAPQPPPQQSPQPAGPPASDSISATVGAAIPPIHPAAMPQLAGMLIQHGVTVGQAPQNPAVMQHICGYLEHDSDNRLQLFQSNGGRSHIFRLCALGVFLILALLILAIPLVALARGDMPFVKEFLDKYFQMIIMIVLALLGGGKLFELLK